MRTRRHRLPVAQLAFDVGAVSESKPEPVRSAATLSDADRRAIARYVVEMLREETSGRAHRAALAVPAGARYVKAEQLMERYQVSMKFIRRHALELGATRLSGAANSKLRYHLPTADAFIESHRKGEE